MKVCYFFLKSKKDLGGRKILFTLWAFSKSQRVEEYKGQTQYILTKSQVYTLTSFNFIERHSYPFEKISKLSL